MPKLERLSISLAEPLLAKLAALVKESGYRNRSEFIRDLVRDRLVSKQWEKGEEALGTVTLVYNHNARKLAARLTGLQHHHHHAILATTHVHLSHDICAEMIMIRGRAGDIRRIADQMRQQKGVLHVELSMSSTGEKLA